MTIPGTCECGVTIWTKDENEGRKAKCKNCGRKNSPAKNWAEHFDSIPVADLSFQTESLQLYRCGDATGKFKAIHSKERFAKK